MAGTNMVVCPEPLAAQAGKEIFAAGGNAVDAAIAAAFVQGVTNPLLCGIGGTGTLYYYERASGRKMALNFEVTAGSRPVPAHWADEYVGRAETIGRYIIKSEANQIGHQSVMLPGFVRGCWVAYQRFGSGMLSWAELLASAIRIAREGYEVYPYIADFWQAGSGGDASAARPGYPGLLDKMAATPDASRIYMKPDSTPYTTGDWLVLTNYADTLERIASHGAEDFYTGELARQMIEDFDQHDGLFTPEDWHDFPVDDEDPIEAPYRGLQITTTRHPSSGPHVVQMLKILEHYDLARLGHNTPEYIDLFARIQRATFADNVQLKGRDVASGAALAEQIVSDEQVERWVERLNAGERMVVRGGAIDRGTTHVTVIDDDLNVVSFNHSIGSLAGSGVITPGFGFFYNNFLGHFNPLPGHSDSIEPGKRLDGSNPAIIFKDDKPYIAIGAPGGSRIITAVTQAIVNVIDHGMDMNEAVSVPRFHSEEEQLLFLEPAFDEQTAEELRAFGNDVQRSSYMARVQAIRVLDDGELEAGADPRGGAGVGRYP